MTRTAVEVIEAVWRFALYVAGTALLLVVVGAILMLLIAIFTPCDTWECTVSWLGDVVAWFSE